MRRLRTLTIMSATLFGVSLASGMAYAQTKIIVGFTALAGVAPVFVAKENGYFANRGLNAELQGLRGGNVLVPSLISNSIQIATLTAPTLVQAVDGGLDIVGLTSLSVLTAGMKSAGIIARNGSNIKTPQDLIGKRVAVGTIGSISQVLFDKWLIGKGIDPKKLVYIEAPFQQMPDNIKTGNVDAVLVPDPLMTAILTAGSGYVLSYYFGELPDNTVSMISASSREWATKNPKEVESYRAAIAEGAAWINANDAKAKEIVGKWLKLSPEIMANTAIEKSVDKIGSDDLNWWIDTLNEQKLLRTKIKSGDLLFK